MFTLQQESVCLGHLRTISRRANTLRLITFSRFDECHVKQSSERCMTRSIGLYLKLAKRDKEYCRNLQCLLFFSKVMFAIYSFSLSRLTFLKLSLAKVKFTSATITPVSLSELRKHFRSIDLMRRIPSGCFTSRNFGGLERAHTHKRARSQCPLFQVRCRRVIMRFIWF